MSLKTFGVDAFGDAVDRGLALADTAEAEIAAREHWEIVTPSRLAIVTFRYSPPDTSEQQRNEWNRRIAHTLSQGGYAFLSTTALQGRTVLRLCTINPRTSEHEVRQTVDRLDEIAGSL